MAHLYRGQLEVEVPNMVNIPDPENEAVYQLFRTRLDAFAKEMDKVLRAEYRRLGYESKEITVDFE